MKYIEDFREGDRISGVYYCKHYARAVAKNGKEYGNVILQDKTGTVDAKIWDFNSAAIREFEPHDYVDIKGDVTVFNGAIQLKLTEARIAEAGTYYDSDYLPCSEYDIEEMYAELLTFVEKVNNEYLHKILECFFVKDEEFIRKFKRHSAAKTVHHAFVGGLLEHTLSVTKLCYFMTGRYKYLNKDLLLTAAMCHDIGKVYELSDFPENDYTDEGQLIGHIVKGCEMIGRAAESIEGFPEALERLLKHCIASHHGEFEFGSPKKPAIVEAIALHYADDTDAKLETFREAMHSSGAATGEWMGFNKMLDSNIRRTVF